MPMGDGRKWNEEWRERGTNDDNKPWTEEYMYLKGERAVETKRKERVALVGSDTISHFPVIILSGISGPWCLFLRNLLTFRVDFIKWL